MSGVKVAPDTHQHFVLVVTFGEKVIVLKQTDAFYRESVFELQIEIPG